MTKLTPAQAQAAQARADRRAAAAERREGAIQADNARVAALYPATVAPKPAPKARPAKSNPEVAVSDRAVMGLMLDRFDRGLTVDGTYAAVWAWVAGELGVDAPWAHYRASQLARVGRAFERTTGVSYATLCPGLPAVAGAWVSDLA